MSVFVLPSGIIHNIEAIIRRFLWAQGEDIRGKARIAWEEVCKPVHYGGLGFKRLSTWNRALVAKNIWDVLGRRNSLWVNWVNTNYIMQGSFWTIRTKPTWSWVFRNLLTIREYLRQFFVIKIGDGRSTNAWEDNWLPCGPLSSIFSYRQIRSFDFSPWSTARDVISRVGDAWPNNWLQIFPDLDPITIPNLSDIPDKVMWKTRANDLQDFTVKEAYISFQDVHPVLEWTKKVWFKGFIPKHAVCLWLACHKRLPTQDRIGQWKREPPDMLCPFCKVVPDSHSHLFFECHFSRAIWSSIKTSGKLLDFPNSWNDIMDKLNQPCPLQLIQKLSIAASVYYIWKERNRRLFTEDSKAEIQIIKEIREVVRSRISWKTVLKSSCVFND